MKKLLLILNLLIITSLPGLTQEDEGGNEGRVRDKMVEYIQERLELTKEEAAKFSPVFLKYFKEWRATIRENKGDNLVLKQKIVDLQLRYRPQFREIVGEKRGNRIFGHQENFIRELKVIQQERRQNKRPLPRRNG
jgi:hypothetical protein